MVMQPLIALKEEILQTPKEYGGFGMVDMIKVVEASRLRRFAVLKALKCHPVESLQGALGGYDYLRPTPKLPIDNFTSCVMKLLVHNVTTMQLQMMPGMAEADLVLHRHCFTVKYSLLSCLLDGSVLNTLLCKIGIMNK